MNIVNFGHFPASVVTTNFERIDYTNDIRTMILKYDKTLQYIPYEPNHVYNDVS